MRPAMLVGKKNSLLLLLHPPLSPDPLASLLVDRWFGPALGNGSHAPPPQSGCLASSGPLGQLQTQWALAIVAEACTLRQAATSLKQKRETENRSLHHLLTPPLRPCTKRRRNQSTHPPSSQVGGTCCYVRALFQKRPASSHTQ